MTFSCPSQAGHQSSCMMKRRSENMTTHMSFPTLPPTTTPHHHSTFNKVRWQRKLPLLRLTRRRVPPLIRPRYVYACLVSLLSLERVKRLCGGFLFLETTPHLPLLSKCGSLYIFDLHVESHGCTFWESWILVLSFLWDSWIVMPLVLSLCTVSIFWCPCICVCPHLQEGGVGPCLPFSCLKFGIKKKDFLAMANLISARHL